MTRAERRAETAKRVQEHVAEWLKGYKPEELAKGLSPAALRKFDLSFAAIRKQKAQEGSVLDMARALFMQELGKLKVKKGAQ